MLYRRGKVWWFRFKFAGRLFQESARTGSKTLARAAERHRRRSLEEGIHGIRKRPQPVIFRIAADEWLALRETTVAPSTYAIERARLAHLKPALGHLLLCDINVDATVAYRERRLRQGASKKTCNLESGRPPVRPEPASAVAPATSRREAAWHPPDAKAEDRRWAIARQGRAPETD